MRKEFEETILKVTAAKGIINSDPIQSLWSGYGEITRVNLLKVQVSSVIVKNIQLPKQSNHLRGWNTTISHQRKIKSYEVEMSFYKQWSELCKDNCRVPKCYAVSTIGEESLIVLEDLDASGYPIKKSSLTKEETKTCLKWLANFHAAFMNIVPEGLWEKGTYWHLSTRSEEFEVMKNGELKESAKQIDQILNNCKHQTFVHGDAKVANFCFSTDGTEVAAVDFQYVGGGCGIKDVAYLMGSCLTESECEKLEKELLNYYFKELESTLGKIHKKLKFKELEKEWRYLYSFAWADFTRFLLGWMPTHQKLNNYSQQQVSKTLLLLNK